MRIIFTILRKILYELDSIRALFLYPFYKQKIIPSLEKKIRTLTLETTNICNANCVFCAYQYQERPKGIMSMDLFKKVIDEYESCGGGNIGLTPTVGDPLVDTHIVERIQYARSKKHIQTIGMYTNMISLRKVGVEALIKSGLSDLIVSMSGFDSDMYKRVYRSDAYNQVVENIKVFMGVNKSLGNPVNFKIAMRVDRPLHEVFSSPTLQEVMKEIGRSNIDVKFAYDNWGGLISKKDMSGNMKIRSSRSFRKPRISPCTELYSGLTVYWDGTVGACGCRDVNASKLVIGNANEEELMSIWRGEPLKRLRNEFLTPAIKDICNTCSHYNNLSCTLKKL